MSSGASTRGRLFEYCSVSWLPGQRCAVTHLGQRLECARKRVNNQRQTNARDLQQALNRRLHPVVQLHHREFYSRVAWQLWKYVSQLCPNCVSSLRLCACVHDDSLVRKRNAFGPTACRGKGVWRALVHTKETRGDRKKEGGRCLLTLLTKRETMDETTFCSLMRDS